MARKTKAKTKKRKVSGGMLTRPLVIGGPGSCMRRSNMPYPYIGSGFYTPLSNFLRGKKGGSFISSGYKTVPYGIAYTTGKPYAKNNNGVGRTKAGISHIYPPAPH